MNKKIIALILFFILLGLNINALGLDNPSYEIASGFYNTGALGWTDLDVASQWSQAPCTGVNSNPDEGIKPILRVTVGDANEGSSVARISFTTGAGLGHYYLISDLNLGTLTQSTELCTSIRSDGGQSNPVRYGVYNPDLNAWCEGTSFGNGTSTNGLGDWKEYCIDLPAATYKGFLGVEIRKSSTEPSSPFNFDIDNWFFPTPLELDILNFTQETALSGEDVLFKIKVLRKDTNTFILDANVSLASSDFNSTIVFNSATNFYEASNEFDPNKIGDFNFTVTVHDINSVDSNLTGNVESFNLNFVKFSDLIIPLTNVTKLSEVQNGATSFIVELIPINESEDLIFYYNGVDSNISSSLVDLNILLRNSDLSGKRYVIYTASEQEFDSGTWNFDSTLSFGSTIYNGLQKIWIDANNFYEYKFKDSTIFGNEIKYFKLSYEFPFKYWSSLNPIFQNDWDIQFLPSFVVDDGHNRDYFAISQFNGMRNQYKTLFPDINSNQDFDKFLLAFNGAIPSGSFSESVGSYKSASDVVSAVVVTPNETTFYVPTGADFPLMKGDSAIFIELMNSDYSLIERGFFIEPLTLLNSDYSVVERLLIEGVSAKVIQEQHPFRIQSKLYNNNGELSLLEAKVYFNGVEDINQVAYFRQDLNFLVDNEIYSLDWLVDGIIDLNGTNARDFVVVLKATTKTGDWFEIQTDTFKLRQFPAYSDEFNLNFYITNKKVGEHLSGVVQINTDNPNALRGLTFSLWKPDTQSIEANDYNTTLFKGIDFTCTGFSCTFNFTFLDHVLDDQVVWALNLSALLTTQLEDTNNFLTAKTIRFSVYFQDINYMRIVETMERTAHTYKHTEPIPLTLILVRGDLQPTRDDLKIVLRAANCSTDATDGTCVDIDINYSADSYVYDPTTGENFYFWRQIYVDQDLSLFDDGDYYRFYAIIESLTGKFSSTLKPLLSAKCQTYDAGDFGHQVLHFILGQGAYTGCTINTAEIVSIDFNSQESRILIDRSLVTQKPNLEFTLCLNADQNNNYRDNLKQDLLCAAGYTFNEAPIDKFDFYLTNEFSDLSRDDSSERQFIKATMPFPLLALNDITLMRQSLKQEYQTEATNIGELLQQGFNYLFTGFANPLLNGVFTYNTMTGAIPNIGADFNLNRPLDPTYIGGIVFFRIKGINVLNKQDLIRQYPDEEINSIDSDELIKYLNYKGLSYSVDPTTIEIYGSDMKRLLTVQDIAPLIINEEFTENDYSRTDENNVFQTLPTKLRFSVITNMWYDDERHVRKSVVPITITALVKKEQLVINDLLDSLAILVSDPARWIGENIFYILIFIVFLLIISVIYYNFKIKGR